jgi:hypothetical protein
MTLGVTTLEDKRWPASTVTDHPASYLPTVPAPTEGKWGWVFEGGNAVVAPRSTEGKIDADVDTCLACGRAAGLLPLALCMRGFF